MDWASIALAALAIVVNAAVTWGVVSTKLDWLRADVERMQAEVRSAQRDVRALHARVIGCESGRGRGEPRFGIGEAPG